MLSLLGIQISWISVGHSGYRFFSGVSSLTSLALLSLAVFLSLLSWVLASCSRFSCSTLSLECSGSPCLSPSVRPSEATMSQVAGFLFISGVFISDLGSHERQYTIFQSELISLIKCHYNT